MRGLSSLALVLSSLAPSLGQDDPPGAGGSYLLLDAYGTPLQIPSDSEVEYDQNQNRIAGGGVPPVASPDGLSLRATGNRWSAYALPSPVEVEHDTVLRFDFALDEETVGGFQSVCLDADREHTGTNGVCFTLATSQGWVDGSINVAKITGVGETTHHNVPIGHFFTGTVNYLAFIQDSDGGDGTSGDATISNLSLAIDDGNFLNVEIGGLEERLANEQVSYSYKDYFQDTPDWRMTVTEDGSGVQINGNQWKALPLNAPYTVTHRTVLEFDVVVTDPADFHAICLDADLDAKEAESVCVSFMTPKDNVFYILTTELEADVGKRLAIPYGQIVGLLGGETRDANYLAFVQDNDVGDKRGGRSTFSNIRIYEEDRMDLEIRVYGENVTVPNVQDAFTASGSGTTVQDSADHVLSVSADGKSISTYGNNWKRLKLDAPFNVGPSTMLRLAFDVPHEAEIHLFCLLDANPNIQKNGRKDCFATSGRDVSSSNSYWTVVSPLTSEGGSNQYDILVGSYFTGPVEYLAFALDNDKSYTASRAEGESTWSNIEIYNLPSLNIGLNAPAVPKERMQITTTIVIENNQISYESSSQDNTPIRDHLAVVSEDGLSITAHGNMWRALPLSPPMTANALGDFIVSFDYLLAEKGEFHAFCFEDNLEGGSAKDPSANKYDPARCLLLNDWDGPNMPFIRGYYPAVGEPHRYVADLSKLFDRFYSLNYIALISDNDVGDKSGGIMTISNIRITTTLTTCLKDVDYAFQLSDCTVDNFLDAIKTKMDERSCPGDHDPLLEMFAFWDATTEMEVYKKIEHICTSSYEPFQYDFAQTLSSETQLVKEHIDGGAAWNYERDSKGAILAKDAAGINFADQFASSHLLEWPKHHALDHCDIGAAMCCWVDSRGQTNLVDNTDVCYVNMKESRRTAHVADGYSIYGDSSEGAVNCHGFAWGTDGGSVASALKGNALFKVGFMNGLYGGLKGNVEQVPGAPMCGCVDRMPVVTNAACTKVSDDTSRVDVTYHAALGTFNAKYEMGTIEYSDCGDLNSYYKTLVGAESPNADIMDGRIVGDGGCQVAINDFLAEKGLVKTY